MPIDLVLDVLIVMNFVFAYTVKLLVFTAIKYFLPMLDNSY